MTVWNYIQQYDIMTLCHYDLWHYTMMTWCHYDIYNMTGCSRSCCTTTRGSSRTLPSSRTWSGASWDAALNLSMTWGAGRRESVSPRHLQFHINCIQRFRMPTLFPLISPVTEVRSPPSWGNIYLIEMKYFCSARGQSRVPAGGGVRARRVPADHRVHPHQLCHSAAQDSPRYLHTHGATAYITRPEYPIVAKYSFFFSRFKCLSIENI